MPSVRMPRSHRSTGLSEWWDEIKPLPGQVPLCYFLGFVIVLELLALGVAIYRR